LYLLDKGIHPLQISSGFDKACDLGIAYLETLKEEKLYSTKEDLVQASKVALSSKVVSSCKEELAQIAAEAVLSVADMERKEVNLELIKIVGKTGRSLSDTSLINGILIDKEFSHPQMIKKIENAKVAILTCPFEPPKPKTKYNLNITNA
jgi:T-complex protein 1 subunit epsilon